MDRQRIIFITLFLITTVVLGFTIYWVFFRTTPPPSLTTPPPTSSNGTNFPTIGEGQITQDTLDTNTNAPTIGDRPTDTTSPDILDTESFFPSNTTVEKNLVSQITTSQAQHVTASQQGGARFYNNQNGKFYHVANNGTIEQLTDKVFYSVDTVTWSPTSDESIIEYPDGQNIYYNFKTSEQVTLPSHWQDFSFSDDGSQIVSKSIGLSPENRWLIASDPKGKTIHALEPMGENADKVIVDWSPNEQVVALSLTGEALGSNRQELLLIGQNKENFKSIIVEGRGLQTQWSPDGGKLLHSVYSSRSDYKPELWIVNATPDSAGQNRKPLGVNTWASKCSMSDERFVYCGVPDSLETGAGFAPQIADTTPDTLYKIDTQTGAKTIIPLDQIYSIDTIFTSPDGSTLYFTDKFKNGIFDIPIN